MPTSPTRRAADDGRQDGHAPTVADRIRAQLRGQRPQPVDHNGFPVEQPPTRQNGDNDR